MRLYWLFFLTPILLRQIILIVFFYGGIGEKEKLFVESFPWLRWIFHLIQLHVSFDFTETPSPRRYHGEPSPSQRRALVIATPSLRQLVESKGTLQSIQKNASDDPRKRFSKSIHARQTIHIESWMLWKLSRGITIRKARRRDSPTRLLSIY